MEQEPTLTPFKQLSSVSVFLQANLSVTVPCFWKPANWEHTLVNKHTFEYQPIGNALSQGPMLPQLMPTAQQLWKIH